MSELHPVLKIGSNGFDVRKLQSKLLSIGYSTNVDGIFGNNTSKIVKEFQKDAGISNDGVAEYETTISNDTPSEIRMLFRPQ